MLYFNVCYRVLKDEAEVRKINCQHIFAVSSVVLLSSNGREHHKFTEEHGINCWWQRWRWYHERSGKSMPDISHKNVSPSASCHFILPAPIYLWNLAGKITARSFYTYYLQNFILVHIATGRVFEHSVQMFSAVQAEETLRYDSLMCAKRLRVFNLIYHMWPKTIYKENMKQKADEQWVQSNSGS